MRIRLKSVIAVLAIMIGGLVVAGILTIILRKSGYVDAKGFIPLFNMDREANVPAWYSSTAILLCSLLLGIIAVHKRQAMDAFSRHWLGLCLIFLYMSADETAAFHERIAELGQVIIDHPGALKYAGLLPGLVLFLVVGLAYLSFLRSLAPRTRNLFILAGVLFMTAVIVVEALSYGLLGSSRNVYMGTVIVEETMEMLGIAVFAYALMDYLRGQVPAMTLEFE